MKNLVVSTLMSAACFGWVSSAFAVNVTHSVDGVVFSDGFEANSVGSDPAGWTVVETNSTDVEVVQGGGSVPPAYEGSKHLDVRVSGSARRAFANTYTSGTITAEFAFYLPSTGDHDTIFTAFQHDNTGQAYTTTEHWIGFADSQFINTWTNPDITNGLGGVYYYPGTGPTEYNLTAGGNSFTFALDAWHEVSIAYNIADQSVSALTIIVDGITLDALPVASTIDTNSVQGFLLKSNSSGIGYIDAIPNPVPEPSSLFLLIGGFGTMLIRKSRARIKKS